MAAVLYQFRPMSVAHLSLVRGWLAEPHVIEWWGDAEHQFTLIRDDIDHPAIDQFIVATDDRSFGYLQCYDPGAWPEHGLGALPAGTRGIDQFIGERDMVGRGHGSAFIRAFVEALLASGTPQIVTDPDPDNSRAVRAYEKAGFHKAHMVDTPDGRALLMVCTA